MSHRSLTGIATMVISMAMAVNASAFDGKRQGFVLGLGLGPSLTSWTAREGRRISDRQNAIGFASIFELGYGVNENLSIYCASDAAYFGSGEAKTVYYVQGMAGIGGSYFLYPKAPSLYLHALVGISVWATPVEHRREKDISLGLGFGTGIGYEVAKNFALEATLMYGMLGAIKTDEEIRALTVLMTMNLLGY
jgi:hypothetical protein